jgi:predicted nucleic acid-binding protein
VNDRYHLDANVVLRFLRNDDPKHSPAAARLFARAKAGEIQLLLSAVTIAEAFYVLARVYKHAKPEAASKLLPLVQSDLIAVADRSTAVDALLRVSKANVDFGDAYLAATAARSGNSVASFDPDFGAFPDVRTLTPS